MNEDHDGRAGEDHEDGAPVRLPYVPPSIVPLGTLQDLTQSGVTGQADGAGFTEIGGS